MGLFRDPREPFVVNNFPLKFPNEAIFEIKFHLNHHLTTSISFFQQDFSPSQRRHWNLTVEGVAYVSIIKATTQDGGEWECWHYNKNSPLAKIKVMKLTVSSEFTNLNINLQ